ncbi:MAG: pyridoxamine 5'-phosphate oxidase family protein [Aristaeellaceae bacterium]
MPELRYQELNLMQMLDVLRAARLTRLAVADGPQPYVVPLCYQLEVTRGQIVIHLSMPEQGRKVDILHRNALVCLEFELPACAWVDVVVLEGRAAVGMREPGRGMDVCIQAVSMTGRRYFAVAD